MTKKEITILGYQIVGSAGEARSNLLNALKFLSKHDYVNAKKEIDLGNDLIRSAHQIQTDLLRDEAQENYSDITIAMVHGQDHLMTTILLRELIELSLIKLYKKVENLEKEVEELKKQLSEKSEKSLFRKWKNI